MIKILIVFGALTALNVGVVYYGSDAWEKFLGIEDKEGVVEITEMADMAEMADMESCEGLEGEARLQCIEQLPAPAAIESEADK